jgi:hypothetical protein
MFIFCVWIVHLLTVYPFNIVWLSSLHWIFILFFIIVFWLMYQYISVIFHFLFWSLQCFFPTVMYWFWVPFVLLISIHYFNFFDWTIYLYINEFIIIFVPLVFYCFRSISDISPFFGYNSGSMHLFIFLLCSHSKLILGLDVCFIQLGFDIMIITADSFSMFLHEFLINL